MTKKPSFLVDANVIVYSYGIGVWNDMLAEAKIVTASSIVQDEAKFYSQEWEKIMIDLPGLAKSGKLQEVDPTVSQIEKLQDRFGEYFVEGIDEGERDILAYILTAENVEANFCSADRIALDALAMLGMGNLGISLKEILKIIGYQKSDLGDEYKKPYLEKCFEEGRQNRITGLGLSDNEL
ncbi:MAG: hypothetical protein V5A79_02230 [Candidatus Bipolaricaulota bacterium]|nr:hypothetical protein [Candidatus Bipolaricaulota bacterium]